MTASSKATCIAGENQEVWGRMILSHPHYYTPNSIGCGIMSCLLFEMIDDTGDIVLVRQVHEI